MHTIDDLKTKDYEVTIHYNSDFSGFADVVWANRLSRKTGSVCLPAQVLKAVSRVAVEETLKAEIIAFIEGLSPQGAGAL